MAFDTSGFSLNLGQEQAIVPSLANLAPYAPNFQGLAWKPADIKAPVVVDNSVIGKAIGSALGDVGKGISVAYKSAQDEKKEARKYALESAKLAASESKDAIREARAQQTHADSMAMQNANLAVSQGQLSLAQQRQADKMGGGADYSEYLPEEKAVDTETGDRIIDVMEGIKKKETPQYFPGSKLELGAPAPPVDEPGMSFDGENNLGSLSAPVAMPPQEDQRYAALRDLGGNAPQFSVASADGAGMQAPTPNLPYSLQGGVPKPLADVQVPSTRELYAGSGFTPTPIPTYGTTTQEAPAAKQTAPKAAESPFKAFAVVDTQGVVRGYKVYDKVSKKLLPGGFTADSKSSTAPLESIQIPEGQKLKGMTISAEGKPSYTYGLESEGKSTAPLLQDQMKVLTNIEGANATLNNIETKLKEIGSSTGPVVGTARGYNPYDVEAQSVDNMVASLVSGLARGVFGEVGVLTDSDVKRYTKLIPNMRTDPKVAQQIMKDLREKLDSTKKANLGIWEKAGYNTKGFQETKSPEQIKLETLAKELDSAKDQNSPEYKAKDEEARKLYRLINNIKDKK
jgi:hypothetical protein